MKKDSPLVSFIISAFNEEKFIVECIESCLNQTYKNIEVVVTDDGSVDKTYDIVIEKYLNDKRVIIDRFPENRGKVAGFNNSFELSNGEFIAIIGADDINYINRIEIQLNALLSHGYSFICSDLNTVNENLIIINRDIVKNKYSITDSFQLKTNELILFPKAYGSTLIAKKSLLENIFPLPSDLPQESWWIPIKLSLTSPGFFINTSLVGYRRHCGNTTSSNSYSNFKRIKCRNITYYKALMDLCINDDLLKKDVIVTSTLKFIKKSYYLHNIINSKSIIEYLTYIKYYINISGIDIELIKHSIPPSYIWYLILKLKNKVRSIYSTL